MKLYPMLKKYWKMVCSMSFMLALGMTLLIALTNAYESFTRSLDAYSDACDLPDLTIMAEPFGVLPENPYGVERLECQLVVDCALYDAGDWLATARCTFASSEALRTQYISLASVEPSDSLINVNIDANFAELAGLSVGDRLEMSSPFGMLDTYICSVLTAPVNFLIARDALNSMDYSGFGYMYIDAAELNKHTNIPFGTYNQVLAYLSSDAQTALAGISRHLTVRSSFERDDAPYFAAAESNIKPLKTLSYVAPPLIFGITIFISYLFMAQIVQEQKQEIGLMRALGYSVKSIVALYAAFGLAISALAIIAGVIGGYILGGYVAVQYFDAYVIPVRVFVSQPLGNAAAVIVVLLLGQVSTIISASKIAMLDPADAFRSIMTATVGRQAYVSLGKLPELAKAQLRFALRNRKRTLVTIASIAMTGLIFCCATAYSSALYTISSETTRTRYRYDALIRFAKPLPESELEARAAGPITLWEPASYCEAVFAANGVERASTLFAASSDSIMVMPEDRSGNAIRIPNMGVVLEHHIARDLGVTAGDSVSVDGRELTITDISYQDVLYTQYVSLAQFAELRGANAADCMLVRAHAGTDIAALNRYASSLEGFDFITHTAAIQNGVDALTQKSQGAVAVLLCCGFLIGLQIIYNMALINFNERKRDYCIMMVQGIGRARVVMGVASELLAEYLLSMALTAAVGMPVANVLLYLLNTDVMSFRNIHPFASFALIALMVFMYMLCANALVMLKIRKVDLADFLKTRE